MSRTRPAGVAERGFGDLCLAGREVMIERAFGRFAQRRDLVDPGRGIAGLAEQFGRRPDDFLAVLGRGGHEAAHKAIAAVAETI